MEAPKPVSSLNPLLLHSSWSMNILHPRTRQLGLLLTCLLAGLCLAPASAAPTPQETLGAALGKLIGIVEPEAGAAPQTLSVTLKVTEAHGLGKGVAGSSVPLSFQAPDRLKLEAEIAGRGLQGGRNGQTLWIKAPGTRFGVVGSPGLPRFASRPDEKDGTGLPAFALPLPRAQVILLPLLMELESFEPELVHGARCEVVGGRPQPQAIQALKLPRFEFRLWVRECDRLPARLSLQDDQDRRLVVEFVEPELVGARPEGFWEIPAGPGDKVETVALSHLTRFLPAAVSMLDQDMPSLGPATGRRQVLATEGAGRLEDHDGTKVLFLRGSPEQMGHQHGVLMQRQVRDLVEKILYGIGVGSSFEKGRWFFGEIEEATSRLRPFIDERYLREMDAMAAAARLDPEEVRLANFFPELFHCSGFAVFGSATADGRLYHGRILDYLRGVGLEPNAVVIVHQPDYGFAWANVSYGGFIGSVTAMNDQQLSIGEMGGRGEGDWDGKPMAQLVREVMERAATLDEAIEILRRGPRTCEYYYVVADGKTKQAAGIAATPTTFEVVRPGEAHPRLPHAIPDAVLMSAGDRYELLAERVQDLHGRLDAPASRDLMKRPVAMTSNIHSVLFAPETLDFWVANADADNVASHCRYTHYNLRELLRPSAEGPTDHQ